eukprot:scaffold292883_cov16-Prasinocladus_malaysianus.AAC.1
MDKAISLELVLVSRDLVLIATARAGKKVLNLKWTEHRTAVGSHPGRRVFMLRTVRGSDLPPLDLTRTSTLLRRCDPY